MADTRAIELIDEAMRLLGIFVPTLLPCGRFGTTPRVNAEREPTWSLQHRSMHVKFAHFLVLDNLQLDRR